VTDLPIVDRPGIPRRAGLVLLSVLISMAAFWLLMPSQFADPFVRSDDYPALFGDARIYYWKTLTEGRWLNHLWHLRPWPFDRHLLFYLYMALWCLAFSLTAAAIFRDDRQVWRIALVGFALAAMPQGAFIAGWHNTLVPANLLLALYAGIVAFASARTAVLALFLFVPLIITAYTTYPILLLAMAMVGIDWRDQRIWRPLQLGVLFCVIFVIGVLTMYALNWVAHDHFGIQIPSWRAANPARDLAGIWSNLLEMGPWWATLAHFLTVIGETTWPMFALLGALAVASLLRDGRTALAAVIIGVGVSIGFILAQRGVTGVSLPMRSTGMLWVLMVGLFAFAWRAAPSLSRSVVFAAVILLQGAAAGNGAWNTLFERQLADYQRMTAQQAEEIRAKIEAPPTELLYVGNAYSLPHAHVLQFPVGHHYRLMALLGWPVIHCDRGRFDKPFVVNTKVEPLKIDGYYTDLKGLHGIGEQCERFGDALRGGPVFPEDGWVRQLDDGYAGVAFSDTSLDDTPP
jgi:hypothetical protein